MRLDPASEVLPFGDLLMDEVFFTYGLSNDQNLWMALGGVT